VRARSRRWAARTLGWRLLALRQRRYACSSRVSAVWLGWLELAIVKERRGPNWASVNGDRVGPGGVGRGQAQFDLVPRGPGPDGRSLVRREVVEDDVDRCVVGAGGADGLQRGQGVVAAFAAAHHAPELVVADAVAAV